MAIARQTGACLRDIDVIVLAGGFGTRLRSALPDRPKVLAPVGDRIFLDILLDRLAGFGAQRVVLALGHMADAVTRHLANTSPKGMDIVPVVEDAPLGTGGALRLAATTCRPGTILAMNGDTLIAADLCAFAAAHRAGGAAVTMMCARVADAARFGRMAVANGKVQDFLEKDPDHTGPALVSAGVYLMEPEGIALIPDQGAVSLESDVLQRQPPGTLGAWSDDVRFMDIGTPESFLEAAGFLTKNASGPDGGHQNDKGKVP